MANGEPVSLRLKEWSRESSGKALRRVYELSLMGYGHVHKSLRKAEFIISPEK